MRLQRSFVRTTRPRAFVVLLMAMVLVSGVSLVAQAREVAASGPSTYASEVLADAPVAYFRLGDAGAAITDNSGHSHTGTASGAVAFGVPGALAGDTDTAASFGGGAIKTSIIQAGATAYSMEAWVKTTSTDLLALLTNRRPDGTPDKGLAMFIGPAWSGAGPGSVTFAVNGDNVLIGAFTAATVNDGAWHHIVGVFNGAGLVTPSQFTIYIDGIAQIATTAITYDLGYYTGPASTPLVGDPTGTSIGTLFGHYNFDGSMDEIAIYDHALSAARVAAHYEASVAPVACAAGSFSSTGNAPCTAAPAGSYVDVGGALEATLCAPGSYQSQEGSVSCDLAPVDSYVAVAGATTVTLCPVGTTTNGQVGQTDCSPIRQVVTSADQCKKGGWHALTDLSGRRFKNQGDCVSYVATAGRNRGALAP